MTGSLASPALSARPPTKAELASIKRSLIRQNPGGGAVTLPFVLISTAAPGWAVVGRNSNPHTFTVFHRKASLWRYVGWPMEPGQPLDGICAYVPTPVVVDLFHIHCPLYRALHARRAPPRMRKTLTAALLADTRIRVLDGGDSSHVRVYDACISRLNPKWAGALVAFPDTGLVAWFHEIRGRWRVFLSWRLPYPPHAPVLSLASCVNYDAAEFGA